MDASRILGCLRRAKAEVKKSRGAEAGGAASTCGPREVRPRPGPATGLQQATRPQHGTLGNAGPVASSCRRRGVVTGPSVTLSLQGEGEVKPRWDVAKPRGARGTHGLS